MTATINTYEGMFLLDAGQPDFEAACEPIRRVLARGEAEVLAMKLWEERRLAYEIKGRRRGLYVLTYFKLDAAKMAELESDCRLEEKILRVLLLRNDNVTEEVLKAETPATCPRPEFDERDRDRGDRGDRDRGDRPRRRRDEEDGEDRPRRRREEGSDETSEKDADE